MPNKLLAALGVLLTAFLGQACCDGSFVPHTDQWYFDYAYADTNALFDSVYNVKYDRKLWEKQMLQNQNVLPASDTSYIRLPLDPTAAHSEFVFYYPAKPPDTLLIEHEFEIKYKQCEDYYFEAVYAEIGRSTFADTTCLTNPNGQCVPLLFYLH